MKRPLAARPAGRRAGRRVGRWVGRGPLADLPTEVAALTAVAFMVAVGFGVVAPAIAPFAQEFGVSKTAAAAVISAFAFARLLAAPFAGRLVNALGERVLLGSGIAVVALSSALAGFSQSYWQLLLLRGVGGVGSIMFSVSAASLLYRVTPPEMRGRAQGVFAGGFLLGAIAGPALGVIASWSLRAPFFLYAGTLAVAGWIGLRRLRNSPLAARRTVVESPVTLRAALRDRRYVAAMAATFAESWSVVGVRSAIVPLFIIGPLALATHWIYVSFFVVTIVSGSLLIPVGRWADSRGRLPLLAGGFTLAAAGLLVLPLWTGIGGVLVSAVLLGAAGSTLSVVPGAMVGDVVGARGGTVVAAFQMASDLGTVLGPLVAGFLADRYGFSASFVAAAAVAVLPIVFIARAGRQERVLAA